MTDERASRRPGVFELQGAGPTTGVVDDWSVF
jgi:hypothetical protein